MDDLKRLLSEHPGHSPVLLHVGEKVLRLPSEFNVDASRGLMGELRVLLLNTDRAEPFAVTAGDRIAQLLIVAFAAPAVVELDTLEESERGTRGFGSSGVRQVQR